MSSYMRRHSPYPRDEITPLRCSLTVADGPRLVECGTCGGEGEVGTGRMSHSVNSATIDPPWEITERCPWCEGTGGELIPTEPIDAEDLEDYAPAIGAP